MRDGIRVTPRTFTERMPAHKITPSAFLVQSLPAVQALCDLVGLALGPRRRRMGCKIAGGGDEDDGGRRRAARKLVVPKRRLDGLYGVEVTVLAQQRSPQHGQQSVRFYSLLQAVNDELSGLVHALLPVEKFLELVQPRVGILHRAARLGN